MSTVQERSWCLSARLGDALRDAWGDNAGRVDALLSLEPWGLGMGGMWKIQFFLAALMSFI